MFAALTGSFAMDCIDVCNCFTVESSKFIDSDTSTSTLVDGVEESMRWLSFFASCVLFCKLFLSVGFVPLAFVLKVSVDVLSLPLDLAFVVVFSIFVIRSALEFTVASAGCFVAIGPGATLFSVSAFFGFG